MDELCDRSWEDLRIIRFTLHFEISFFSCEGCAVKDKPSNDGGGFAVHIFNVAVMIVFKLYLALNLKTLFFHQQAHVFYKRNYAEAVVLFTIGG